ncbi:MAG: type II toxin-antitoxin system VapC family toxin [Planctomycetes bacterium]|nr:type II toxin-antitoxin system VapC family toxin [Planctomycetota bacterium]
MNVLDAHALMAYLNAEPGCLLVRQMLSEATQGGPQLLMCSVNLGEVYHTTQRRHGLGKLPELDAVLAKLPIQMLPADVPLAKEAAAFKATKKMSYADCFAAALAKLRGGRIVTGDPEFREVEAEIPIAWLPHASDTPAGPPAPQASGQDPAAK